MNEQEIEMMRKQLHNATLAAGELSVELCATRAENRQLLIENRALASKVAEMQLDRAAEELTEPGEYVL